MMLWCTLAIFLNSQSSDYIVNIMVAEVVAISYVRFDTKLNYIHAVYVQPQKIFDI